MILEAQIRFGDMSAHPQGRDIGPPRGHSFDHAFRASWVPHRVLLSRTSCCARYALGIFLLFVLRIVSCNQPLPGAPP